MKRYKPSLEDYIHTARNEKPVVTFEESVRKLSARRQKKRLWAIRSFRAFAHPHEVFWRFTPVPVLALVLLVLFNSRISHLKHKPETQALSAAKVVQHPSLDIARNAFKAVLPEKNVQTEQSNIAKQSNFDTAERREDIQSIPHEIPTALIAGAKLSDKTAPLQTDERVAVKPDSASPASPATPQGSPEYLRQPLLAAPPHHHHTTEGFAVEQQYPAQTAERRAMQKEGTNPDMTTRNFLVEYRLALRSAAHNAVQSVLQNMTLTVLYKLSENHAVGLEAGQEPFLRSSGGFATLSNVTEPADDPNKFNTTNLTPPRVQDTTNRSLVFAPAKTDNTLSALNRLPEQPAAVESLVQPWLGATYQYTHRGLLLFDGIEPLARVMLGFSGGGALGRMLLGVRYAPTPIFSLLFAGEGSAISGTNAEGNLIVTPKLGLTAGVGVRF